MQGQGQPNVDFSQSTGVKCEKCGSEYFEQVYVIRKVSKLIAMTDQDVVAPMNTFRCADCGHINDEFKLKSD
tara:strand:- start:4209 stop:4424 length:216 start_codon:yes stop_codon:yes gene_type:complete